MASGLALLAMGIAALIIQGAIARFIPAPFCPDLALLVVIGLGLRWPRPTTGVLIAVVLGFSMDLVSGSLMGQHALLRLFVFAGAFVASHQLNLSGSMPVITLTFATTVLYSMGLGATSSFFLGSAGGGFGWVMEAAWHGAVNALLANVVVAMVARVLDWTSDDEGSRRSFSLDPPKRVT
jgi:rod shape-determining protein MreD